MTPSLSPVTPPAPSEYADYYGRYISLVPGHDVLAALESQPRQTVALLSQVSEHQGDYRYAPGKWSIKEVLGHLIDTERVFAYRALCFARGDQNPLPSFEQDEYVRHGDFSARRLADLIAEFDGVRHVTRTFFGSLSPEAWLRRGVASGNPVSVRAIAYIIAGHELHHRRVLEERYLRAR